MTHFVTMLLFTLLFLTSLITARYSSVAAGNDIDDFRDDPNADPFGNNEIIDDFEAEDISDDTKCAYATTGGIAATPLGSCWNFEQTKTSQSAYSYDFTAAGLSLSWNYYNGLDCKDFVISTAMSSIHQSEGSGTNCETVQITKSGSFSKDSEKCFVNEITETDYYSMSYVINECTQTSLYGQDLSVIMFCDSEKLYFNKYTHSTQCQGDVEQYIYHYFDDDDCWDIECNVINQQGIVMENGIEDPQAIKRYIYESMMMVKKDYVINDAMNQYQNPWIAVGILVLLSFGLVMMYCYSIKHKNDTYVQIH